MTTTEGIISSIINIFISFVGGIFLIPSPLSLLEFTTTYQWEGQAPMHCVLCLVPTNVPTQQQCMHSLLFHQVVTFSASAYHLI